MVTKEFKFNNGDSVVEAVTGFKGIITGSVYYITGCNQYLIVAKTKYEFSEAKSTWYDEGRLKLVEAKTVKIEDVETKKRGCDMSPPDKG